MIWIAHNVTEQLIIEKFYSCFQVHYENGYDFSGETHNFWECLYVMDGSLCASGDDRVYNLTRGHIIFHKPLELHKFHVDNMDGATLLIFSFSLEGNLSHCLRDKVFMLTESQMQILDSMLLYTQTFPLGSPDIHAQMLTPFATNPTYPQMLTTYVYQLFLTLIDSGQISTVSTSPDALIFGRAVNYINDRICEQPSVSEIAEFCSVSESTLKRIFNKYAGISVHKYLMKLKIKAATVFLQSGSSVTETAEKLGFSSQAYFSLTYKRETGGYPSAVELRQ